MNKTQCTVVSVDGIEISNNGLDSSTRHSESIGDASIEYIVVSPVLHELLNKHTSKKANDE